VPELKKIRVREAKARDIGLFKKLWGEMLEKQDSVIENDSGLYEDLFNAYVDGKLNGVVLFVADKAVLMWGGHVSPLKYPNKPVVAWGMYATGDSAEAIEVALKKHAVEWSKKNDYESLLVQVSRSSAGIEGLEPVATILQGPLNG
jgi:hypothetical protein